MRLNPGGTRDKRLPPDDKKMARSNKTNFSSVFELMLEDNRRQLQELQVEPVVVPKLSQPIASSVRQVYQLFILPLNTKKISPTVEFSLKKCLR